jgi:hypothetical protein
MKRDVVSAYFLRETGRPLFTITQFIRPEEVDDLPVGTYPLRPGGESQDMSRIVVRSALFHELLLVAEAKN